MVIRKQGRQLKQHLAVCVATAGRSAALVNISLRSSAAIRTIYVNILGDFAPD